MCVWGNFFIIVTIKLINMIFLETDDTFTTEYSHIKHSYVMTGGDYNEMGPDYVLNYIRQEEIRLGVPAEKIDSYLKEVHLPDTTTARECRVDVDITY